MKPRAPRSDTEKPAMTLLEEAFSLVRGQPSLVVWHWIGAAPFLVALLYFWADMTWSPDPRVRLTTGSLAVGAAFLWMKMWHVEFMRRARGAIMSAPIPSDERWTARRFATALSAQAALQFAPYLLIAVFVFAALGGLSGVKALPSTGAILLLALPFAMAFLFCMGWIHGFFVAALVEGNGRNERLREIIAASASQIVTWPKQTYGLMMWTFFFGVFVFINWLALIMLTPSLLRMFLGIHTAWTDKQWAMLNLTTFAAAGALSALSLDPILKLAFALRFFYVESRRTGKDLLRELKLIEAESRDAPEPQPLGTSDPKRAARRGRTGATAVLTIALWLSAASGPITQAHAQTGAPPREITAPASRIKPEDLNASIKRTMAEREFAWRLSRDGEDADAQMNPFFEFLEKVAEKLTHWMKALVNWIKEWIDKRRVSGEETSGGWSGISAAQTMMYALVAIAVIAVALFIYRAARGRRVKIEVIEPEAVPIPDLTQEDVDAKSLPVNEWLELARKLAGEGNPRLALRAVYLATLAALGERQLIRIARHKTNREYQREVGRRAQAADLAELFNVRVRVFERAWYGRHEVGEDDLRQAISDYERIESLAARI